MTFFDPLNNDEGILKDKLYKGINICCDLIDRVCQDLRLSKPCTLESMYILNLFFTQHVDNLSGLSTTPKEILAAGSVIARFVVCGKEKDIDTERLIDSCFNYKLKKKERAIRAALSKSKEITEQTNINKLPTLVYEEIEHIFEPSNFKDNASKEDFDMAVYCMKKYAADAYKSPICVIFKPRDIAKSCIYIVMREMAIEGSSLLIDEKTFGYLNDTMSQNRKKLDRIIFAFSKYYEAITV